MGITVKIKRIPDSGGQLPCLPTYGTNGAAAVDLRLFSQQALILDPGCRALAPTGLALELPQGYCALIFARSGLAAMSGVALSNGVGVIDCDYRGEIKVGLINHSDSAYTIAPGDRIAQMMIIPAPHVEFAECAELGGTERAAGGFGSTGR